MVWEQIEPTGAHLTYLLLSTFLICYALFATFIRNRLHLSEPPIALLLGILLGPRALGWLTPNICAVNGCRGEIREAGDWGWGDGIIQGVLMSNTIQADVLHLTPITETTRVIVGIQVFSIAVELPKYYASKHWRSVVMLLGPVMTFGWLVCAAFVALIFKTDWAVALTIAACLTPTDPVLAASILSNSQFSERVPKRIKDVLSAESGCNDGISFPFLYVGLFALTNSTAGAAIKEWFVITILWQCLFGTSIGLILGTTFNRVLRYSDKHGYIDAAGFTVFYLLLAVLSVGIGSTLGSDDFLVAFGAGYGFARDGWFSKKMHATHLPNVIDLMLNSAMFVYLGSIIPWHAFQPHAITPDVTPGKLIAFLALVIAFRRIPIVLLLYRWIPDIRTFREALFAGHFGPMGLGGLFLAIEARAVLENGTSSPEPYPPQYGKPYTPREKAVELIWPLVCFIVFGSTLIHGLSVLVLSLMTHLWRPAHLRAHVPAGEEDPLEGMEHEYSDAENTEEEE